MKTHRILIAEQDAESFLVNMIYAEVGDEEYETFGAFSGMCGGGGLFHQTNDGIVVSDDWGEFQSRFTVAEVQETFSTIEKLRAEFESFSEEGDLIGLSEEGRAFLTLGEPNDHGIIAALSDGASEDFIYDVQDEWNLNFYMD